MDNDQTNSVIKSYLIVKLMFKNFDLMLIYYLKIVVKRQNMCILIGQSSVHMSLQVSATMKVLMKAKCTKFNW